MGILRLRITAMKTLSEASIASQEARKRRGWAGGVFATIQPRFLREEGSTDDVEGSREGGGWVEQRQEGKTGVPASKTKANLKSRATLGAMGGGGSRIHDRKSADKRV